MTPQTILITGTTAGIGKATAMHLAKLGHQVIATGRKLEALSALSAEMPSILTLPLDVTDGASIAAAVQEVDRITQGRGIDVLINNAGYGLAAPTIETTDADMRAQYDTNVFGLMAVTRAFAPRMMQRRSGRILNVSSLGGRVTLPMFGVYNSSKYAVESLSDALRNELHPFGVHVVVIEPGATRTEFSVRSLGHMNRYRDAKSPYAGIYANADKTREQAEAMAGSVQDVARAMERAVHARRPRARYVAPLMARFQLVLFKLLPVRWLDAGLRWSMGLTPSVLRLDTAPSDASTPDAAR